MGEGIFEDCFARFLTFILGKDTCTSSPDTVRRLGCEESTDLGLKSSKTERHVPAQTHQKDTHTTEGVAGVSFWSREALPQHHSVLMIELNWQL